MKTLIAAAFLMSSTAFAQDLCSTWRSNPRYDRALNSLAQHLDYSPTKMCTLPGLLGVEVQPSRVITPQGDVEPHVRVYLHKSYESCFFMVRDEDQVITDGRCFSGF